MSLTVYAYVLAAVLQVPPQATGALMGVVRDAASGQGVSGAVLTVTGNDGAVHRALSDDEGRFSVEPLPAGRYRIAASKPGYLWGAFAAPQPQMAGPGIELGAGQRRDAVDIRMTRAAVMAGVVRDEYGRGIAGIAVQAVPEASGTGSDLAAGAGGSESRTVTDARGAYRIAGLVPGEYFLVAEPPQAVQQRAAGRSDAENDALLRQLRDGVRDGFAVSSAGSPPPAPAIYGPTYFPGTPEPAVAAAVAVRAGEVRDGLDMVVQPVRLTRASGTISLPYGYEAAFVQVLLVPRHAALRGLAKSALAQPAAGFRFAFDAVAPGPYVLVAQGPQQGPGPDGNPWPLWSVADLNVPATDVFEFDVRLEPSASVTGDVRVDRDGDEVDPAGWTIRLSPYEPWVAGRLGPDPRAVSDDAGHFAMAGVPPTSYDLSVTRDGARRTGWRPATATWGGADALDAPLIVRHDPTTDLAITVTSRDARLIGRVEGGEGVDLADFHLLVFPRQASLSSSARRFADVQLNPDGQYDVRGLPDGDYFAALLVGPVGDLRPSPALFQALSPSAVALTLTSGETTTQNFRIGR
ncbi:MAG: carboxypeptidase-like regulatory domain-containing protein [Vicinamibacterales bacterium]